RRVRIREHRATQAVKRLHQPRLPGSIAGPRADECRELLLENRFGHSVQQIALAVEAPVNRWSRHVEARHKLPVGQSLEALSSKELQRLGDDRVLVGSDRLTTITPLY